MIITTMAKLFLFFRFFNDSEIEEIRKIKLWDIIVNSTEINPGDVQRDVFFWFNGDPCPQPMQLNASVLDPCNYLQGFDYFEVHNLSYKRLMLI